MRTPEYRGPDYPSLFNRNDGPRTAAEISDQRPRDNCRSMGFQLLPCGDRSAGVTN